MSLIKRVFNRIWRAVRRRIEVLATAVSTRWSQTKPVVKFLLASPVVAGLLVLALSELPNEEVPGSETVFVQHPGLKLRFTVPLHMGCSSILERIDSVTYEGLVVAELHNLGPKLRGISGTFSFGNALDSASFGFPADTMTIRLSADGRVAAYRIPELSDRETVWFYFHGVQGELEPDTTSPLIDTVRSLTAAQRDYTREYFAERREIRFPFAFSMDRPSYLTEGTTFSCLDFLGSDYSRPPWIGIATEVRAPERTLTGDSVWESVERLEPGSPFERFGRSESERTPPGSDGG